MKLPDSMLVLNGHLRVLISSVQDTIDIRAAECADYLVKCVDFNKIVALNILRDEFGYSNSESHHLILNTLKRNDLMPEFSPQEFSPQEIYGRALELVEETPGKTIVCIKILQEEFGLPLPEAKSIFVSAKKASIKV